MPLVTFGSVAGSPGVTSLTVGVASAWPHPDERRVVVEADPDGGRLGADLGIGVEPGLMAVAVAARSGRLSADDALVTGAAAVGSWFTMPAPPSGEQTSSVLAHASTALADLMRAARDHVWLVDTGRMSTRSPSLPFARAADQTVLVTAGSFPALQLLPTRVEALSQAGCRVALVVVEPLQWSAVEVAEFVGADVLGVVPFVRHRHRRDIGAMSGGAWRGWWRQVERLAALLAVLPEERTGGDPAPPAAAEPPAPTAPRWPA